MKTLFFKALNVEPEESGKVTYLLLQGFFMGIFLASFEVGTVTLFLREFDEGVDLPLAIFYAGCVGIVVTYLFSFLQARIPFKFVGLIWLLLIVILVGGTWYGFHSLIDDPAKAQLLKNLYFAAFVLALPFGYISLLVFWGAFGRMFTLRQSKRIIGGIDTGQLVASILALFAIGLVVEGLNRVEDLLLISVVATILLFINFFFLSAKYELKASGEVQQKTYSFIKIASSKYIRLLAIFVIISTIAIVFMNYSFLNVTGAQFPDPKDLASFIAYFEATVVIFSFLFQTFVTDWIISNYGLKISLLINPILIGGMITVALVVGGTMGFTPDKENFIYFFLIIAGGKLFIDAMNDALDGPSFKLYFLPIDSSVKFDVQTKIEGVIAAFAAALGGGIIIIMNNYQLQFIFVVLVMMPIVGIWYYITTRMYGNYRDTLQSTLEENKGRSDTEETGGFSLENVLKSEVESKSDERVIYGLKLMEKLEPGMFENSILRLMESNSDAIRDFVNNKIKGLDLEYDTDKDSETHKLALKAIGESEQGEVLSIPSSKLHNLSTSLKQEDRLLAAKLLRRLIDDDNIFILMDLLRDPDPTVKMTAIVTARKVKRQEIWPILIEMLDSPAFGQAASSALLAAGEEGLFTLESAFHKSGRTQNSMLKIVSIIGRIGGREAFDLLWKKIDYHDRKIVNKILNSFRSVNYSATESEITTIHELIDDEIGKTIWNMAAIHELPDDDNNRNLINALNEEIDADFEHIYMLLSLVYDPESVALVKENIETGLSDGIAFAVELMDIFLAKDMKPKLFPLVDDIRVTDKIEKLQVFFPRENYTHHETLNFLLNRDYNNINRWTKVCALKSIESLDGFKISRGLVAQLFNPDPLLQETAAWILYKKDKRTYQRVSQRLDEEMKRTLDEKLFSTFFFESKKDDFPFRMDKILFLKEIEVFSSIRGINLSQIVDKIKTVVLKDGESQELYDEDDNKPIFIIAKGEATLYNEDIPITTLKEKEVFGDIFTMDAEQTITSIKGKNETIIFQIGLNDFFNVMANQHELAQEFIKSVSKNFTKDLSHQ